MTLTREMREGVAWLCMDDGKANALSMEMLDALDQAIDDTREASAVVICGRPGRFSAGFDLKHMQRGPKAARELVIKGAHFLMKLYGLNRPVIAACSGHAVAGGALMLMACDWRVGVSGDFKIGLNETAIGMRLPGFGHALAADRLSPRYRGQATLQATLFGPAQAVEVGFLDLAVGAEIFEEAVQQSALRLSGLSAKAYAGCKQDLRGETIARVLRELDANIDLALNG